MSKSEEEDIICKNPECKTKYLKQNTILKHITKAKSCIGFYTDQDLDDIRAVSFQKKMERQRQNYKPDKGKAQHNLNYSPSKRRKIHEKTYSPEKRHDQYTESIQKKQEESSFATNLKIYRHDCQYGPIFT